MSAPLLVELLTEELPPKALRLLSEAFKEYLVDGLMSADLVQSKEGVRAFATPRRLAVLCPQVREAAPDKLLERKGPAVSAGLDGAGRPTKALEGFMRSAGVEFGQLQRLQDGKGEYFVALIQKKGEALDVLLPDLIDAALKKLPVPKVMRWGDSDHQFVRPVHGLVVMHGKRVLGDTVVLGLHAGNRTRGHRFLSAGDIFLESAEDYEAQLEHEGRVIASFERRRALIADKLAAQARSLGAHLKDTEALLDEVTALVEWPEVYVGEFEREFLEVPQECLILTMQQNQKYFPLFDEAGRLQHRFLIVANMVVANPRHIIGGNQRVVRPRLADARFFFDQDRKQRLETRVPKLAQVVYHNKLGSQLERVERLQKLADAIARRLHADRTAAERAAYLAKADLLTGMVGEFPELQGIMGRYYARHDGESPVVADAIEAHYRPRFAGDALPEGNVACAVALADKLDALIGFFGIGQVPSGDKDPFGLRRAALGVLRILIEKPLPLDLGELITEGAAGFPAGILQPGSQAALYDFMLERLRGYLREAGHALEAVEAVLALRPTRIDLVLPKLEAVREFVRLPEAQSLAAANKRIVNILKKAPPVAGEPDVLLLQESAEKALFQRMNAVAPLVKSHMAGEDYTEALKALAQLRETVDTFFDRVMVMVDEPLTRQNRLALLSQLAGLMNQVADISRLSV
ncbi:MAG: glycine--tRNA ligase subunit beta [Pseudomonadota bacterium]